MTEGGVFKRGGRRRRREAKNLSADPSRLSSFLGRSPCQPPHSRLDDPQRPGVREGGENEREEEEEAEEEREEALGSVLGYQNVKERDASERRKLSTLQCPLEKEEESGDGERRGPQCKEEALVGGRTRLSSPNTTAASALEGFVFENGFKAQSHRPASSSSFSRPRQTLELRQMWPKSGGSCEGVGFFDASFSGQDPEAKNRSREKTPSSRDASAGVFMKRSAGEILLAAKRGGRAEGGEEDKDVLRKDSSGGALEEKDELQDEGVFEGDKGNTHGRGREAKNEKRAEEEEEAAGGKKKKKEEGEEKKEVEEEETDFASSCPLEFIVVLEKQQGAVLVSLSTLGLSLSAPRPLSRALLAYVAFLPRHLY